MVAASWLVYHQTGSSLWTSLIAFMVLAPIPLVSPIAGAFADRFDRATIMAIGTSLSAVSCLGAALLSLFNDLSLGSLLVTVILAAVGNAIQDPAWQSLIPPLLGPEGFRNGALLTRVAQQGAELVGPALGTTLLVSQGAFGALFLAAGLYSMASFLALRLRGRHVGTGLNQQGIFSQVGSALRYVKDVKLIGALLVIVGLHCGLTMAYMGIIPALSKANLHGTAGTYGVLVSSVGFGAMLGPLIVTGIGLGEQREKLLLFVTGILSGLSLAGLAFSKSLPIAISMTILVGASQSSFMAVYYAMVQGWTEDGMRGRVAGFSSIMVGTTMSSAALLWGALTSFLTPALVLIIPGLSFVGLFLLLDLRNSSLRPTTIA